MLFDENNAIGGESENSTKLTENLGVKQKGREKSQLDCNRSIQFLREGSDFLTCVVGWPEGRHLVVLSKAKDIKISMRSFSKLMSQLAYLYLFLSSHEQTVFMSRQFVVSNHSEGEQDLSLVIVTEQEFEDENEQIKQYIQKNYRALSMDLSQVQYIKLYDEMYDRVFASLKICFEKQLFDISNMAIFEMGRKQFQQFMYIMNLMVKPNLAKIKKLSILVRILEESVIFRQYSLILKFSNGSVLLRAYQQPQFKQNMLLFFREYEKQLQKNVGSKVYKLNFKPVLQKYFEYLGKADLLKIVDKEKQLNQKPYLRIVNMEHLIKNKDESSNGKNEKQQSVLPEQQNTVSTTFSLNGIKKPKDDIKVYRIYTEQKPHELMMAPKLQLFLSEQKEIKVTNPQIKKPTNTFQIFIFLPWQFTVKLECRYIVKREEQQHLNCWINKMNHLNECVKISMSYQRGCEYGIIIFEQKTLLHIKDNFFVLILKTMDELLAIAQVLEFDIKFRSLPSNDKLLRMSEQILYLHSKIHSILQQIMIL